MNPISVGASAPDFQLPRKIGEPPFRLSDQRGKFVVVLFFPLAFSGVCTKELCQVRDEWDLWRELDAVVVAISVDSAFTNHRFAQETKAPFPVLSDFNREACTAYGVRNDDYFGMRGVAQRSAFVVDANGVIRFAWVEEEDGSLPDFQQLRRALAAG
ncbi:MAG: redoxin domain-containing protein [Gemmatimonadetes bacterium]|nr:redoxin domain-containing protein [Gemmatimonadota bacterium]